MGVGGLLMEIPSRPQPREERPVEAGPPRLAAVLLAAGRSTRMGGPNKLLVPIDGKPMVRHAAEAARAAGVAEIVVVTGHMAAEVERALAGLAVRIVHNPDHASGLASSLRAGIAALGPDIDGAFVLLGDMPRIAARHLQSLAAAFDPAAGRGIVVPTRAGRRGNPVLWGRAFFKAFRDLDGDVGARHLIGAHPEAVAEVEMPDEASLLDIDTPEALAALRGAAP
jgi:molybdenum cofactor cytidylyltransferase